MRPREPPPKSRCGELLRGGDAFMNEQQQLTQRRHIDLVRVSSSLCPPVR
ncbi:putative leader peptide [Streptomyces sp. NPDC017993]